MTNRQFYIDGQWVMPAIANDFDVINPSTGQPCGVISLGSEADTDAAVKAASKAFNEWRDTPLETRCKLVEKLINIYQRRSNELGEAMSLEMGAPIDMCMADQVGSGYSHLCSTLAAAKNFTFEALLEGSEDTYISYEPMGVCALITPWNWPMNQITLKVAPAILAGCTMVLKPSEIAPLSALLFAEMIDEAGFPAGVFNLVNGDGAGVGSQLSSHADIDMVSFTGSTRAGTTISKNAADSIKKVSLELGGKGANILFADADDGAVQRGVERLMHNTGQSCDAPGRMLVQRPIYQQVVELATSLAEKIKVAEALKRGEHLGPVVSIVHYEKIQHLIQKGIDGGATLTVGGLGKPELPEHLQQGFFVKPTIFADVTNDMCIAKEEIFGPVLAIIAFDTEEEAIQMTNDTPYGLTNFVETTDIAKAKRLARQLRSGVVELNGSYPGEGAPFGGFKQSGNGREGGRWGLEDYLQVKTITGWSE